MYYKTQTFLVFGLSNSGKCAAQKLLSLGAKTFVYDEEKSERVDRVVASLSAAGATFAADPTSAVDGCDVVIVSPGVRIDHPLLVYAKKKGKRIIGELEFGSYFMRAPILAVTGTNGKTTTCSMIAAVLTKSGIGNALLGNYGVPLTVNGEKLTESDVAVTEVSSFQLETVRAFCPHVAVILNVTSDHLDRHYTRENYVYLKSRILSNQRESEYSVLNFDDETVRSFGAGLKSKVVWFSKKSEVGGAYLKDGVIYYFDEKVFDLSKLKTGGEHNVENALAAVCACKLVGADNGAIAAALENFRGVKHRVETIAEIDGVEYVNDSKATNVDSTVKAIDSMKKPFVIILGGKDKKQDYAPLFERLKTSGVRHAVLTGEECFKLLDAARAVDFKAVSLCRDFETAVRLAKIVAKKGDAVLLSPATSSFDDFSCFEERGAEFERIVKDFK